jgi:hypothetical protein
MNHRKQLRRAWLAGSATLAVLASVGLTASVAHADPPVVVTTALGSDPYLTKCNHPTTGVAGFCLYTSQDMGTQGPPGNTFQMHDTRGYFSTDGRLWEDAGMPVLTENNYPWVPKDLTFPNDSSKNANHQWAPAMAAGPNGSGYFLYVPNVTNMGSKRPDNNFPNAGVHRSSVIGVSQSSDPLHNFTNNVLGKVQISGVAEADTPYMSDPEVFTEQTGQRHLLWNDGDGDTCGLPADAPMMPAGQGGHGGLHIGSLRDDMRTVDNSTPIAVDGVPAALNKCHRGDGKPDVNAWYMEGPSLFDSATTPSLDSLPGQYTLVFPAVPAVIPPECSTSFGQPNTANEVIAYATADSLNPATAADGTKSVKFTYQGIIMCGSPTEFTNQATFAEFPTASGSKRLVMMYHDGPAGSTHKRQLHNECLMVQGGKILTAHRSTDGLGFCMSASHLVALQSTFSASFYTAVNADGSVTNDRDRIGWWEQFDLINLADGNVAFKTRNGNHWLTAEQKIGSANFNRVVADRPTTGPPGAWEEFTVVNNDDGSISLKAKANGHFVTAEQLAGNNHFRLVVDRTAANPGPWEKFKLIDL